MAKVSFSDMEDKINRMPKPKSDSDQPRTNYLSLKDGESINVIVPYETLDDVPYYTVWEVMNPENKARFFIDTIEECEQFMADKGFFPSRKFMMDLPVYSEDGSSMYRALLERGPTFKPRLMDLYEDNEDVPNKVFTITRRDAEGKADFKFKALKVDKKEVPAPTDLPDEQVLTKLAVWTADEIKNAVNNGEVVIVPRNN